MPSYVITGSSRGIGLEFVRQLSADKNNTVIGVVRNKAGAKDLAALAAERSNVHVLQADVTDWESLKAAAAETAKITGGSLDYLINNAAYVQQVRFTYSLDTYAANDEVAALEKDFHENINANVLGVIHSTNAFLPLLQAASATRVAKAVTISSGVGDLGLTHEAHYALHAPYCISKAAVNMVNAKYAARFAGTNLVFLALCPGLVNTATGPPTPEGIEMFTRFVQTMKPVYPDWDGQALTPEESVKYQLAVINNIAPKDSGAFLSHYGNKKWI